jgi:hypothetical protein
MKYFSAETSKPVTYISYYFVIFEVVDNLLFEGTVDIFEKRKMKETVMWSFLTNYSPHTVAVVASTRVR